MSKKPVAQIMTELSMLKCKLDNAGCAVIDEAIDLIGEQFLAIKNKKKIDQMELIDD